MKKTNVLIIICVIIVLLIIALVALLKLKAYYINKNIKDDYIETHMEYEQDKKYVKCINGQDYAYVNDNPIIPTGYFRQEFILENYDDVKIVYYIPEGYINGHDELMRVNGNQYVQISTNVDIIPEEQSNLTIDEYLEYIINQSSNSSETISLIRMDCNTTNLNIIKTEFDNHTTYELNYIYKKRLYTLSYDISNKANTNEIETMKKVFASMKLVDINIEYE